jgi:hypothetical protein
MIYPVYVKAGRKKIDIPKEVREVNRLRINYERSMARGVYGAFQRAGDSAALNYERVGDIGTSIDVLQQELTQVFRSHYQEVIQSFANRVMDGRKFTSFTDFVSRFYIQEGGQKVVNITETTRRLIMRAIRVGEIDGEGVDKISKRIVEKTSGAIGRSRAATIARTETHAAASWATDQANRELGLPNQRKRWVSVQDARSREHHSSANGQEVGIDEPFIIRYLGQEIRMMHPHDGSGGPANNINCRCVAIYFSSEDDIFADFDGGAPPPPTVEDAIAGDVPEPAVKPKPASKWGDGVSKTELDMHDMSWSFFENPFAVAKLMRRVVQKTKPVDDLVFGAKGAYAQGGVRIAMRSQRGQAITGTEHAGIWRHEYGHHVDYNAGKSIRPTGSSYISNLAARELKNDAQDYAAINRVPRADDAQNEIKKHFQSLEPSERSFGSARTDAIIEALEKETGLTSADLTAIMGNGMTPIDRIKFLVGIKHRSFDYLIPYLSRDPESSGLFFADYVGAITKNRIGYGHTDEYYSSFSTATLDLENGSQWVSVPVQGITTAQTTEAMANYFALMGSDKAIHWRKLMDIFAPATTKKMDELMELIDGRL